MTSTSALLDNSTLGTSTVADHQATTGSGLPNTANQTRDLQQLNSRLDEILSRTRPQPGLGPRSPTRTSESYLRSSPMRYSAVDPRTIGAGKTVTFASPTRVSHIDTSYVPHYAHTYLERPVQTSYVNGGTYKTSSPGKDRYTHTQYEPVHYTSTATRVVESPTRTSSKIVKPATYHEETVKEVAYQTQKVLEPYTYTTSKVVQPEPVVYEKIKAPSPTVSTRIIKPATYHEETVKELAYQTQRVIEPYTYTTSKVVQPEPITYEKIVDTHYEPSTIVEPERYIPREVVHPPTYHTETVLETAYQTQKVQEPYTYTTSKVVEPEPVTYATTRVGDPVHHSTRLIADSPKKTNATSLNDLTTSYYRPSTTYESTLRKSPTKVETTKASSPSKYTYDKDRLDNTLNRIQTTKATYSPSKSYSTLPTNYAPVSSSPYYPTTHAYPTQTYGYPAQTHAYPSHQYVPTQQYVPAQQYGSYYPGTSGSATRASPKSYLEPDRRAGNAGGKNHQGGLGRLENDVESMTFDDAPVNNRKGGR